ncbi:MAG: septum site-determining protein MinC [Thermoanaerobacteraceae bacterium]|jgi:septum site-determining protein MinC|nr:septum site-determining protein MinC [Thermoanaerobacteraceae bacterium]MDN5311048.1 septum site-determining protein MinC [Thermoanaerobacteraceae bacterium]
MKNKYVMQALEGIVMAIEPVIIKGNRDGISIILEKCADFESTKNAIYEKLKSGKDFFAGSRAHIKVKNGTLSPEEYMNLEQLLKEFDMSLQKQAPPKTFIFPRQSRNRILLLKKTVRSGQKISYKGTIVILGDVNPGSEIVAAGDILVMGVLRGMAHAGARGDMSAIVAAFRLQPTQLRIAGIISRPPEEKQEVPQFPEIARLKDKAIIIEPYYQLNFESIKRKQEGIK